MRLRIGRTGALVVLLIFLLLAAEDIFIWLNGGAVPGIEFFLAAILVVVLLVAGILEAREHPPPQR